MRRFLLCSSLLLRKRLLQGAFVRDKVYLAITYIVVSKGNKVVVVYLTSYYTIQALHITMHEA